MTTSNGCGDHGRFSGTGHGRERSGFASPGPGGYNPPHSNPGLVPRTQNVTQQTPAGPVTLKVYLAGGQTEALLCTPQHPPADRAGASDDQILDQAIEGAKLQAKGATAGPTR